MAIPVYKLVVRPVVYQDIAERIEYLTSELADQAADGFERRVNEALINLPYMPRANPVVMRSMDLRKDAVDRRHAIFYSIRGRTIVVIGVLDRRRDWRNIVRQRRHLL